MSESKVLKIVIADDHPLFRCGLRLSLNQSQNLEVIGEAENGFNAVDKIIALEPDVSLIDVDMPGLSGIAAIRMLRKALPDLKIMVLSAYDGGQYVRDAMSAGADGYILKSIDVEALIQILILVGRGQPVFSPYLLNLTLEPESAGETATGIPHLSVREKEVLRHLVEGKGNSEIAGALFISYETVKSHIKNIFKKLNVTNRVEAVRITSEQNLLNP